jgi:uncharacterized protein (TIGR00369 family)
MTEAPRSRSYSWAEQRMDPERVKRMSGLEFLQAILVGDLPKPAIADTLGYTLTHVEKGLAIFEGGTAEYLYNPLGTVHGGYAATLLDSAMACSIQTTLPVGMGYTTVELKVNYIRPLTAKTGMVRCEGRLVHAGGRIGTAEGRLVGARGRQALRLRHHDLPDLPALALSSWPARPGWPR